MATINRNYPPLFVKYLLSATLIFPLAAFGARSYKPSITTLSYSTMAKAEAAMRAVSPAAAKLQFDSLLSDIPTPNSNVLYTVPDVQPNPPLWMDCSSVAGAYGSGQAVCDARRVVINWANPLTYVETNPSGSVGNGEGLRGECGDLIRWDKPKLGFPQRWRSCPAN